MNINFNHIIEAIEQLDTWQEVAIYLRGAEYMGCYANLPPDELEILSDWARIAHYESLRQQSFFFINNQLRD